jgi:hypothetical protein
VGLIFIVLWVLVSVGLALAATHWWITRHARLRQKALESILRDKGEVQKPGEPIREALLRARRKERGASHPPAPLPSFARSLERPKSRSSWTNEANLTGHVGGRTRGSEPPSARLRPARTKG